MTHKKERVTVLLALSLSILVIITSLFEPLTVQAAQIASETGMQADGESIKNSDDPLRAPVDESVPTSGLLNDDFADSVSDLISRHPVKNGFASIVFDTEENTVQTDGEEPVPLADYGIDFSDVVSIEPVFPIMPVLEEMGVPTDIDEETEEVVIHNGQEVRCIPSGKTPSGGLEEIKSKGLAAEGNGKTAHSENEIHLNDEGFVTFTQARERFHCEAEITNGKIIVTNPFQSMRLVLETVDGGTLSSSYGAEAVTDGKGYYVLQFDSEAAAQNAYKTFQKDTGVRYVVPDEVVSSRALENRTGAQTVQSDRFMKHLKDNNKTSPVTVAVVDTGVDVNHPFLKNRTLKGYNFYDNNNNVNDGRGHGTHVSGIVVDNSPNTVSILPVKVLNDGGLGTNLTIKLGIDYAVRQKANVINLSLGGYCVEANCPLALAIKSAVAQGVTVVVAAGNDSMDAKYTCPAHLKEPIVVAASSGDGAMAIPFSNYGATVDVTAPGTGIYSSIPGGGYEYMAGTSMAAPFVSAAAAMFLTDTKTFTPAQVENKMCATACDMLTKGKDVYTGVGLLNFGIFFGDTIPAHRINAENDYYEMFGFKYAVRKYANIKSGGYSMDSIPTDRSFDIENSNPAVAVFDGRYITAKSGGTATFTLRLADALSTTFTVKVTKKEVWIDYASANYAGGTGVKSNPYQIATAPQLAKFALDIRNGKNINGKHFKLMDDIDLAGKEWITAFYLKREGMDISSEGIPINFDGNNHLIKNMRVFNESTALTWFEDHTQNEDYYAGNTGFLGNLFNSEIKNLGIVNAYSKDEYSSLLASVVYGDTKIDSCYTTGFSGGTGFVRLTTGSNIEIRNCFSSATVQSAGIMLQHHCNSESSPTKIANTYFCGELLGNDNFEEITGLFSCALMDGYWGNSARAEIYNCFTASLAPDGIGFISEKNSGLISKCYYFSDNFAGLGSDAEPKKTDLKAKSLSFFKTKQSFTTGANWNSAYPWDFTNVWAIDPKINNGFPYLKKLPQPPPAVPEITNTWVDYAASNYAGGNGTEAKPFLIETPQQLARIAKVFCYGGGKNIYFKLNKDINLAGHDWRPIGAGDDLNGKTTHPGEKIRAIFYGNIDGNNKKISNLRVNASGDMLGLICILQNGIIKNLTLENVSVKGGNYVGAVTGWSHSYSGIYNCNVSGSVQGANGVGSVTGRINNLAKILGASATAAVRAEAVGGGIAGYNHGEIEKSRFTGSMDCPKDPGGIASQHYGKISDCYSRLDAPLIGTPKSGDIYHSYSFGVESSLYDDYFGNTATSKTISPEALKQQNTFVKWDFEKIWKINGTVNGGHPDLRLPVSLPTQKFPTTRWKDYAAKSYAGGKGTAADPYLIATPAQMAKMIVTIWENYDAFNGKHYRLIRNIDLGQHLWFSEIRPLVYGAEMYFDGNNKIVSNMTTDKGAGLFEFWLYKGYIKNLHLTNVKGFTVAGILCVNSGTITGCSISGEIFPPQGYENGSSAICLENLSYGLIERCFSMANVTGSTSAGGLTGQNDGMVKNCYVRGNVFSSDSKSIAGNSRGLIETCYATGRLTGQGRDADATYIDEESSGCYHYQGSRTTGQMKTKSTYVGWDFEKIWGISANINNGYPHLLRTASCKISYVLNGGKNPAYVELDYIPGSVSTLPVPTRDGYTFSGWFQESALSGSAVKTISSSSKGDKTFYAKWTKMPDVTVITGNPVNMTMNKTVTLKATLSPANSAVKVTWKSSDSKIAAVDAATGKVTAKAPGQAAITATAGGDPKSVTLTVHRYVSLRIGKTTAIQNETKTTIDSQGTKPFKISGKTMVPARFVAEKMGGKVSYTSDKQPIVMTYGNRMVELKLNSKSMKVTVDSKTTMITLDVAAQKRNGRTYIPLRAISQALGFTVYYDAMTEIIVINNPNMSATLREERIAEGKRVIQ